MLGVFDQEISRYFVLLVKLTKGAEDGFDLIAEGFEVISLRHFHS